MSSSPASRLQDHRVRKRRRLELATALYRGDPRRAGLIPELARVLRVAGADRAAVVWVDEYDEARVHGYAVLDLGSGTPRRSFPLEPLLLAWREGVPGLVDGSGRRLPTASGSLVAVALGSDGTRAWFLVGDGRTTRPALSDDERASLMWVGGRCAGVVLHRDLDRPTHPVRPPAGEDSPGFAGWPILRDGDESKGEDEQRRIALRFLVGRLVALVVDDDLVFTSGMPKQAKHARRELEQAFLGDPERSLWEAVLACLEAEDVAGLAEAALALARHAAETGHLWGALELCWRAYGIALATGEGPLGRDAAAMMAGVCRRLARRRSAKRWARIASGVEGVLRSGPGGP